MSWYTISQKIPDENSMVAYHGSDVDRIKKLKASNPPYVGGIGFGVYVGLNKETAERYGRHIYRCRVNFGWDKILDLNLETVEHPEEFQGHSIGVGENIPPFYFYVKGQKYLVSDMDEFYRDTWIKNEILLNNFESLVQQKNPWWKEYISKVVNKSRTNGKFLDNDPEELKDALVFDNEDALPEDANMEEFDKKMALAANEIMILIEQVTKGFSVIEISLEEVGEVAEEAGYRGVYLQDIRVDFRGNEELLVFDENDVIVEEQLS